MLTEIEQHDAVGQLIAHERLGGSRYDDLATVCRSHQPGAAVDGQAGVPAVVDDDGLGGVQPDACFQWR